MRWNKVILVLLIALLSFPVLSQTEKRDMFTLEDSLLILKLLKESETETLWENKVSKSRNAYLFSKNTGFERGAILSLKSLIDLQLEKEERIEALRYCFSILPLLEHSRSSELPHYQEMTGDIYAKEELYNKALEYYDKAEKNTNAFDQGLLTKIVNTSIVDKDYHNAIEALEKIALHAPDAALFQQFGFCYQQLAKNTEALYYYKKALNYKDANKALIENNIGYLDFELGNYNEAITHFNNAYLASRNRDEKQNSLMNLAIAYQKINKNDEAIATVNHCMALVNSEPQKARYQELLSRIYLHKGDVHSALTYSTQAIKNGSFLKDYKVIASSYLTRAQAYQKIYDFENALSNYKSYLSVNDSVLIQEIAQKQQLDQKSVALQKTEKELKESLLNDQIKFLTIQQLQLESDKLKLHSEKLMLEAEKRDAEISNLRKEQEVKEARLRNIALENEKNRQKLQLAAQELLNANINRKLESLKQQEERQRLELANKEAMEKQRLQQISLLERDKKISDLEVEKQKDFKRNTYIFATIGLLLLLSAIFGFFWVRNKNIVIEQSRKIIESEKHKSEGLLLNILPVKIADELKEHGESKPIHYDTVSILFTDFVKFTQYSERVSNEQLISDLNTVFQSFDEIIDRHNLEKIKTIGDSYMCAGGLPVPNDSNPFDAVNAALEMRNFMSEFNEHRPEKDKLHIRIGINTGPCIAGVVGKRKFAYDIWGDAVNTAARMEQSGESGKINVSENTYEKVKGYFDCEYRGMIEAKNKGRIKMYFAEHMANQQSDLRKTEV